MRINHAGCGALETSAGNAKPAYVSDHTVEADPFLGPPAVGVSPDALSPGRCDARAVAVDEFRL
jgi:hypothetical protein